MLCVDNMKLLIFRKTRFDVFCFDVIYQKLDLLLISTQGWSFYFWMVWNYGIDSKWKSILQGGVLKMLYDMKYYSITTFGLSAKACPMRKSLMHISSLWPGSIRYVGSKNCTWHLFGLWRYWVWQSIVRLSVVIPDKNTFSTFLLLAM